MNSKIAVLLVLSASVTFAQWNRGRSNSGSEQSIRANIRGGGGDNGKCTAEVDVDGVAEVAISGDTGRIRTLSGQPARWVRLDCTGAMPRNPGDFRFSGIDGRGSQDLVRDPNSNGGIAIVRIEDSKGGREGYTFDLEWRGGYGAGTGSGGWNTNDPRNNDGWNNRRDTWNDRGNRGWDSGSGGTWDNSGWGRNWGDRVRYTGRGQGQLQMERGGNYRVYNADVNVNRNNGRVVVNLDTDSGNNALRFTGRIQRIDGDTIYADVRNAGARGDMANASGIMQLRVRNDQRVEAIAMDGSTSNGRFRLNWND